MDCKKFLEEKQNALKDYITKNSLKCLVLGVSGGVDSALMAAICRPVCDELNIPLIGVWIEIDSNKSDEKKRALNVCQYLCTSYTFVDLTEQYHSELEKMEEITILGVYKQETAYQKKVRLGNIKARQRMIYLYNIAQRFGGVTLNTDNRTEWELGFFTLHGDHFDICILNDLWKTEVYELSNYVLTLQPKFEQYEALRECILAVPTDGLGITNSDFEQFGCNSYNEVDAILKPLCSEIDDKTPVFQVKYDTLLNVYGDKVHKIWNRHKNSAFKRIWPIKL